MPIYNLKLKIR